MTDPQHAVEALHTTGRITTPLRPLSLPAPAVIKQRGGTLLSAAPCSNSFAHIKCLCISVCVAIYMWFLRGTIIFCKKISPHFVSLHFDRMWGGLIQADFISLDKVITHFSMLVSTVMNMQYR